MLEHNRIKMEEDRLQRDATRKAVEKWCVNLFDELDDDDGDPNGEVPKHIIQQTVPHIKKMFKRNSIAFSEAELSEMVDIIAIGDDSVHRSEFVHGIISIANGIRAMSILELHHDVS